MLGTLESLKIPNHNVIITKYSVFYINQILTLSIGLTGGSVVKKPLVNAGDPGLTTGLGRSSIVGNGNRLQYSCLENFTDRGFWKAIVYGVTKSQT